MDPASLLENVRQHADAIEQAVNHGPLRDYLECEDRTGLLLGIIQIRRIVNHPHYKAPDPLLHHDRKLAAAADHTLSSLDS